MGYSVGIDVGTSYTAAAIGREGRADVFELGSHSAAVPTVLAFESGGGVVVGEAAQWLSITDPECVVREFKRRLGDPVPILVGGQPHHADDLMAQTIRWVVDQVVGREDQAPDSVVITHPANWGPYKLEQFGQAAYLADVTDPVLLSEPEAAARHYAAQERLETDAVVAVYDLGGGTFDVALLRHTDEGGFELAGEPGGIERLGGVDFDEAVFGHVRQAAGVDVDSLATDDPATIRALAQLRQECVTAKELLSTTATATIPVMLPSLQTEVRLTRDELEGMIRPSLMTTISALDRTLRAADLTADDIHAVLLVGGSSRIPLVAELISSELRRPVALDTHPKFAVALGAARRLEVAAAPAAALASASAANAGGPSPAAVGAAGAVVGGAVAAASAADVAEPTSVPAPERVTAGVASSGHGSTGASASPESPAATVTHEASTPSQRSAETEPTKPLPRRPEPARPATGAPAPPMHRKRRWWLWALVVTLLVGAIAGIAAIAMTREDDDAAGSTSQNDSAPAEPQPVDVDVPNVVGMAEGAARRMVEDAGLTFAISGTEEVGDDRIGDVLDQSPRSGSAEEGSTVGVVLGVERGVVFVEVPAVEGLSPTAAASRLSDAGLGYGAGSPVALPYGDAGDRLVQSQNPAAGESVAEGTVVTVRIGEADTQPDSVTVPNVVDLTSGDARSRIVNSGFRYERGDDVSLPAGDARDGRVVDQVPSAETAAEPDSTITIRVGVAEQPSNDAPEVDTPDAPEFDPQSTVDTFEVFAGWAEGADVDLVVTSSTGETLSYQSTASASGGNHTGDAGDCSSGFDNDQTYEQVWWAQPPPVGYYAVEVHVACSDYGPIEILMEAFVNGELYWSEFQVLDVDERYIDGFHL